MALSSKESTVVFLGLVLKRHDFENILMIAIVVGIALNVVASVLAWRDYRREMIEEDSSATVWEFWSTSYTLFPTRPKLVQRSVLIIGMILWAGAGVLWTGYGFREG